MPQQTIGSQIQTDLRRVQRQQDIEEYEDYRLLNKLMSSTPDSGVQESRDLTIEGKVWDKTKLGIDSQFDVIRNFVSDEKGKDRARYRLQYGSKLFINDGDKVEPGQKLVE